MLEQTLHAMQDAQLIRALDAPAPIVGDASFFFKHALVQDTAYKSLMRHDRRRLHLLVGEALEQQAGANAAELAPLLAQHFSAAGETARALNYLQQAGDNAAARYANREALTFYAEALDAADEIQAPVRAALYRSRSQVLERIGEFEAARADLENALRLAKQQTDTPAEWQSLNDLGFIWSARDYGRAGDYFARALDLAREMNDSLLLAHSLNRMGNWYLNNEDPLQALTFHREALSIFETLANVRGVG
jgi:tetratricopeptide (TPR) repeat protein